MNGYSIRNARKVVFEGREEERIANARKMKIKGLDNLLISDIAGWIIFQIREGKVMSTANHLVEAERILQRMIEKNPVLQKLIDDLDLVLVGASPIGNDDEKPP